MGCLSLIINPSGAVGAWRRWRWGGGLVVTQRRGGGDYVDDICIGEEVQRWRTRLTESIYMTALLGSSLTDNDPPDDTGGIQIKD